MESVIAYLKRQLNAAGSGSWEAIAAELSEEGGEKVSVHLLRKIAYGDRSNPGVAKVQPLLDFFQDVDAGRRELPKVAA